ncbi:Cytochrome c oxidase subunit 6b-1, partial [Cucurbita argyrosperma subsp. argyrosperma]
MSAPQRPRDISKVARGEQAPRPVHEYGTVVVGEGVETAPNDMRFPFTNQTRHCYTRYLEYHSCVQKKGKHAPECNKFAKYYRSLCPAEWIEKWNEQRELGIFPGPI